MMAAVGMVLLIGCANLANLTAGARRRRGSVKLRCGLRWAPAAGGWSGSF